MKKKEFFILIPAFLLLFGCEELSIETKSLKNIQKKLNTDYKGRSYCFYLGDIDLPYAPATKSSNEENRLKIWVNNELNRRLDLFTQLQLLQKNDKEGKIEYSLTDLGKAAYGYKSFCFGDIDLQKINTDLNTEKNSYIDTSMNYNLINVPEWANSDLFKGYFYRYNDENNGIQSYPLINEEIKTAPIKLEHVDRKKKNSIYRVDWFDHDKISSSKTYDINDPKKTVDTARSHGLHSYTFAYYDFELAKKLFTDSLDKGEIITYWGEPDPIIEDNTETPDYIEKANAFILMHPNSELILSKNKIKSIQIKMIGEQDYDRSYVKAGINIELNEKGGLNSFSAAFGVVNNDIVRSNLVKKRTIDYNTGKVVWGSSEDFRLRHPNLYHSSTDVIYYTLDSSGQIVGIYNKTDSFSFTPQYDNQNRLIQYGNVELIYEDDRLIEKRTPEEKTIFSYDKKNQLSKLVVYQLINNKYIKESVCVFADHNKKGDWTRYQCSEMDPSYRQITYFDDERSDSK